MVFSSLIFMFVFLPIVLAIYYLVPFKLKNLVMLIASLFFYSWGEPVYIVLMVLSILVNYFGSLLISANRKDRAKAKFIFFSIILFDICILLFFKYYGFLISNVNILFKCNLQIRELPFPLGISFYTFKLISYVADVYMKKSKVQKSLLNFATYISMFPQVVSGPIDKYSQFEAELNERKMSLDKFGLGVSRFIEGLGKKVLLANNLGVIWTQVKDINIGSLSILSAWVGIVAFTLQIYYDFSGYSDMAIGIGKMFGFTITENFDYPYMSKSVTEFWRRWHMSLGSWFREYIYIPLGGNRVNKFLQFRNIMIVWIVTGLWHGAKWNFIFWGLYFGFIIYIEKIFLNSILDKMSNIFRNIYTMLLVIISWVFFDLEKLSDIFKYIKVMFFLGGAKLFDKFSIYLISTNLIIFVISIILATNFVKRYIDEVKKLYKKTDIYLLIFINLLIVIISIAYLIGQSYNAFLYFKF